MGLADTTDLIVVFRNFANTPKEKMLRPSDVGISR